MNSPEPVWRALTETDLSALMALARRVLAADGGLPAAATESFLRPRYLDGVLAATGAHPAAGPDPHAGLVAAAALRPGPGDTVTAATVVDPAWAGPGLTAVLDWILQKHHGSLVRVETEALTDAADELLRGRGLRQVFAEDVLRLDLDAFAAVPAPPPGTAILTWSAELAPRFYAVYTAAFAERPGFPGWSFEQWSAWITGDDEFAPQWSLLATRDGADVGFVVCAQDPPDPDGPGAAFVVQVGVTPSARGAGLGGALTGAALSRMRADGAEVAMLDVNVDNPGAARVYHRLGFVRVGRRARYAAD